MQKTQNVIIDAETIIVNLMREDNKEYLPIPRLRRLVNYIYKRLEEFSNNTRVIFDVSFDAIKRAVLYNNNLFELVGDTIYLKIELSKIENIKDKIDNNLEKLIRNFSKEYAYA